MRSKLILAGTLLLLMAVFAALTLAIQRYTRAEATAFIRVDRDRSEGTLEDYQITKSTYAQLITSPHVMNTALNNNKIRTSARIVSTTELLRALHTDDGEGELIAVKLLRRPGWSKQETTNMLQAVVDAFIDEVVNKERLEKFDELKKFRERYSKTYDEIVRRTEETNALAKTLGVIDSETMRREFDTNKDNLLMFQEKLLELELEKIAAEANGESLVLANTKIQFVEGQVERIRDRLTQFGGTSGELEARRNVLAALRNDLKTIQERRTDLEIELEQPPPVVVVQMPVFMDD